MRVEKYLCEFIFPQITNRSSIALPYSLAPESQLFSKGDFDYSLLLVINRPCQNETIPFK